VNVPTSSWYYNSVDAIATNVQRELKSDFTLNAVDVTGTAPEETFVQANGPVSLTQGQAVFVYLSNPSGITAMDAGLDFNINVQAGKSTASMASVHVSAG
jgi:hypothetical protein